MYVHAVHFNQFTQVTKPKTPWSYLWSKQSVGRQPLVFMWSDSGINYQRRLKMPLQFHFLSPGLRPNFLVQHTFNIFFFFTIFYSFCIYSWISIVGFHKFMPLNHFFFHSLWSTMKCYEMRYINTACLALLCLALPCLATWQFGWYVTNVLKSLQLMWPWAKR